MTSYRHAEISHNPTSPRWRDEYNGAERLVYSKMSKAEDKERTAKHLNITTWLAHTMSLLTKKMKYGSQPVYSRQ
jgi:hypothetical protein